MVVVEEGRRIDDEGIELGVPAKRIQVTAKGIEVKRDTSVHNRQSRRQQDVANWTRELTEATSTLRVRREWSHYSCFEFP